MEENCELKDFCSSLLKIELHAHITGSCSDETILKLYERYKQSKQNNICDADSLVAELNTGITNFSSCMDKFGLLHKLCNDADSVYIVTTDVIREFAADNVKYLELRTTLRDVPETGMTKSLHLDTVLRAIQDCSGKYDIIVRLILSIDRRMPVSGAWETLHLAISNQSIIDEHGRLIVGIDLSGTPTAGDIEALMPILAEAKKNSLFLSLHMAETAEVSEEETRRLLTTQPNRIGHGTYLTSDSYDSKDSTNCSSAGTSVVDIVLQSRIPIECCLTSNLICVTIKSLEEHHLGFWYQKQHPCVICTDDKGVFSTTLSKEYYLAATTFNLTEKQLWEISYDSIDHIFADESVKNLLREKWKK